jgi:hypothetical protein
MKVGSCLIFICVRTIYVQILLTLEFIISTYCLTEFKDTIALIIETAHLNKTVEMRTVVCKCLGTSTVP